MSPDVGEDRGRTEAVLPLVPVDPMHIEVIDKDESSNAQARVYAEYRLFAALARHAQSVRGARVVLRRVERNGGVRRRRLCGDRDAGTLRLPSHSWKRPACVCRD